MRLQLLVLVALISWAECTSAIDQEVVEFSYWMSPDGIELYVAAVPQVQRGGPRLYYFSNDTRRLCYTFAVSGSWILDDASGKMQSRDGRGSLGQSVQGPDELGAGSGTELVRAAIESYQSLFLDRLSALAQQGLKAMSGPSYSVEPFTVTGRDAVKWTAHAAGRMNGRDANIRLNEVFVEVLPGWVLAIEARDDVAREAIESLGTAKAPDCFWPLIREQFPAIPAD